MLSLVMVFSVMDRQILSMPSPHVAARAQSPVADGSPTATVTGGVVTLGSGAGATGRRGEDGERWWLSERKRSGSLTRI